MKFKNLTILVSVIGALSCNTDDSFLNFDNNSFVYVETMSYDDYSGDSKLLIYSNHHTKLVKTSNRDIQYQILNSEILYEEESEIFKINPNTNQKESIIKLPNIQINSFQISPDSKYLAFSDYKDIFLVDLDNKTTENITLNLEGDFRFPKWSPDGKSILIRNNVLKIRSGDSAPTITGNFKIYSVTQKNFQNVEMFDEFAYPSQAEWSSNSSMVVYEQYQAIFIFDVVSQQLKRITSEEVIATNPKFSNDGKMLSYFSSDRSHNGNNWQNFLTIFDFGAQLNKIINNSYSFDASWKIDSSIIIYCTKSGIFTYDIKNNSINKIIGSNESSYIHSVQYIN